MTNIQNIKTKRPKNNDDLFIEGKVAELCNCSLKYVSQVVNGERPANTELAEKILVKHSLLQEGITKAVEKLIPFDTQKHISHEVHQ